MGDCVHGGDPAWCECCSLCALPEFVALAARSPFEHMFLLFRLAGSSFEFNFLSVRASPALQWMCLHEGLRECKRECVRWFPCAHELLRRPPPVTLSDLSAVMVYQVRPLRGVPPNAEFDAGQCARVREYIEVVAPMLSSLNVFGCYAAYLATNERVRFGWMSLYEFPGDGIPDPSADRDTMCAAAAAGGICLAPASMASHRAHLVNARNGSVDSVFAVIAIVLADAAQAGEWDPYRVGRGITDCDCKMCDGDWPDICMGPCGCDHRSMGKNCPAADRDGYHYDADHRCLAVDWGAECDECLSMAAAVAHAAEALGHRAAWDARSPAVAAVDTSDSSAWWHAWGLAPPAPRGSRLAYSD